MISNEEVRLAEWIINQTCKESVFCFKCPHECNCTIGNKKCIECPDGWEIPDPPPEPTERQRIEWLRMLPDGEMLIATDPELFGCSDCQWRDKDRCSNDRFNCNNGHMDWWHEVVSLGQFRKDVGLE